MVKLYRKTGFGKFKMFEIPFYDHYLQERNVAFNVFYLMFLKQKINLLRHPCLCKQPEKFDETTPAIVKGDDEISHPCYDSVKRYIQENPQTRFFVLGGNLEYSNHSRERIRARIGNCPNYEAWTFQDFSKIFHEILGLARTAGQSSADLSRKVE